MLLIISILYSECSYGLNQSMLRARAILLGTSTAVSGQVSCFYNYQTLLLLVLISVVLLDCILRGFGVSVATHKSRCEISTVNATVLAVNRS